jgi:type IV pilus assembly protein PilB
MLIAPDQVNKILLETKVADSQEIKKFVKEAKAAKVDLADYLLSRKIVTEELLYENLAKLLKLPYVNLLNKTVSKSILEMVPEPIASNHNIVPYERVNGTLKLATIDPGDLQTREFIKKKTNLELEVAITTPSSLHEILKQYHLGLQAEFEQITKKHQAALEAQTKDKEGLEALASDLPVLRIVDTLLEYAIFEEASDIHIEPAEKELLVRFRVDGILRNVMTLPKKIQPGLVARIKILSNLKLDEHRLPQDGRFKLETDEYKISFRVSVIPVYDGEKVVLRLLNEAVQILNLEQLGLQKKDLEAVKRAISRPHGMILVTGPTGSGKTTTLYTVLSILNRPGVNITTIEDPIEYRMPKINQSQVNPKIGYTFVAGLRSFLRQDPDIIMVGEIRDTETASIAVNAAMTGHLVLSTLHTNDAATALPRLQDMKVPSFLIASTVNVIIAQRLVRKVCTNCIVKFKPSKETLHELEEQFDLAKIISILRERGVVSKSVKNFADIVFFRGNGCGQCGQLGYKGRIGIYEILEMTAEVADLVVKKTASQDIVKTALAQDMTTLAQDGFVKAVSGITSIEEIVRVTKE